MGFKQTNYLNGYRDYRELLGDTDNRDYRADRRSNNGIVVRDSIIHVENKFKTFPLQRMEGNGRVQLHKSLDGLFWAMWCPTRDGYDRGQKDITGQSREYWKDAIGNLYKKWFAVFVRGEEQTKDQEGANQFQPFHKIDVNGEMLTVKECSMILGIPSKSADSLRKNGTLAMRVRYVQQGGKFAHAEKATLYDIEGTVYKRSDLFELLGCKPDRVNEWAKKGELKSRVIEALNKGENQ